MIINENLNKSLREFHNSNSYCLILFNYYGLTPNVSTEL